MQCVCVCLHVCERDLNDNSDGKCDIETKQQKDTRGESKIKCVCV